MPAEISLADAAKLPVKGWRFVEGELVIRSGDSSDERALRCDSCGRRHWIIETRVRERRGILAVRCHGCGAKRDLVLAEFELPSP